MLTQVDRSPPNHFLFYLNVIKLYKGNDMKIYQLIDDKYGIRSAGGMSIFSIDDLHYSLTCDGDDKVIIHPLVDGFKARTNLSLKHPSDQKIMRFHKECIALTPAQLMGFEPGDYLTHKGTRETCLFKEDSGNCLIEVVSLEGWLKSFPVTAFTKHHPVKHKHSKQMFAYATDKNLVVICEQPATSEWVSFLNPLWDEGVTHFLCLEKHRSALLHVLNDDGTTQYLAPEKGRWIDVEGVYEYHPDAWYMRQDCQSRIKPETQKKIVGIYKNHDGQTLCYEETYSSIEEFKANVLNETGNWSRWEFHEIDTAL